MLLYRVKTYRKVHGKPLTGKWAGVEWEDGMTPPLPEWNAKRIQAIVGGDLVPFDPAEEAKKLVVEKVEEVKQTASEDIPYKKKLRMMKEAGFDYLEVTGGSRKKEDVEKAFQEFLELQKQ